MPGRPNARTASTTCFSSWSHSRSRLKVSAHAMPASTPSSVEPEKMPRKVTNAPPRRADVESPPPPPSVCAALLNASTVRARTMATASLSTLSPKTMAKMSSRTPMALKTASTCQSTDGAVRRRVRKPAGWIWVGSGLDLGERRTVTGSVAEMSEPKKSAASLERG